MKRLSGFLVLVGLICSPGCKSSTAPQSAARELVGTWVGTTGSGEAGKTFPLSLSVDATGNVTGSGVISTWSADNAGRVTGGGSFSVVSWGTPKTLQANWTMQLNATKTQLTGSLATSDAFIGTVSVSLSKN